MFQTSPSITPASGSPCGQNGISITLRPKLEPRVWVVLKLARAQTFPPLSLPRPCVGCFCAYSSAGSQTPMEERTTSYSLLCPSLCLPQCLLNGKCSANVGEVCFVALQVARLPVELIYGCRACGHTHAGVAAVLIRTQLEDPTFLLLTLERVKG